MKTSTKAKLLLLRDEFKRSAAQNILYQNPVLTAALGICTIVAAATTLKNGWVLTELFAMILIPVCVISGAFYGRLPRYLRTPAVAVTAAIFYTIGIFALKNYYGSLSTLFRYYLPLMALNSLMLSRAVRHAPRQPLWATAVDAVTCAAAFGLVACLVGALRELFQSGTVGGLRILELSGTLYMAKVPFFGFIVLGFVAAAAKALRLRHQKKQEAAARTAQRMGGDRP